MSTKTTQLIQTAFRTIDGTSIRFAESEQRADHALLLCPWPESLFAWEQAWPRLSARTHIVAIDLPGFGHSERRDDLLSPRAMGEFLVEVANAFDLPQPHLVGPDVGTSAALFAAASHPGRFRTVVVGSGGTAVPLKLSGVLKDWVEAPDLDVYRRMDSRQILAAVFDTIEGRALPDHVREDYVAGYLGDRFAESIRYVQKYPEELPVLRDLLPTIETPVRIIQGAHDGVVPMSNGQFLDDRLPHSELDVIDAGHFAWEESADEYAALLSDWWSRNHRNA